ncbi:hypothetical protein LCDVSa051L [Lymphocystis disease virus 3]|uniref:Uncharacterized protein n=1 Tax=Lymphocystis disease virus 3 TaxID=2560566 RepID=A0A1B2RVW5_9VIRU|nr:hypothetical protein BZK12_gp051 [Lymphocystis disease virus Sa]AOC55135.1 hypothetical protein LCDVSa051L [Lymphocystis disease virus 3]
MLLSVFEFHKSSRILAFKHLTHYGVTLLTSTALALRILTLKPYTSMSYALESLKINRSVYFHKT